MRAKNTLQSKILRKNQTPWERKLWYFLRGRRFDGYKFKRQVPIKSYIVDFCCQEKKVIIEIDGGHHSKTDNHARDLLRESILNQKGYKVLRFWNSEIDNNIEGVLTLIDKYINRPLSASPQGIPQKCLQHFRGAPAQPLGREK